MSDPSVILSRLRDQRLAAEAAAAAGLIPGSALASSCLHGGTSHQTTHRATLFKGAAPLNVMYCEDCGAIGPTQAPPTIGEWIKPRASGAAPAPHPTQPAQQAAPQLPAAPAGQAPYVRNAFHASGPSLEEWITSEYESVMRNRAASGK